MELQPMSDTTQFGLLTSQEDGPLIGLNYVVEDSNTERPQYCCILCDKKRVWRGFIPILNHIKTSTHRLNYFNTHFPSLINQLGQNIEGFKQNSCIRAGVLEKLAQIIEDNFERGEVEEYCIEDFKLNEAYITDIIRSFNHVNEGDAERLGIDLWSLLAVDNLLPDLRSLERQSSDEDKVALKRRSSDDDCTPVKRSRKYNNEETQNKYLCDMLSELQAEIGQVLLPRFDKFQEFIHNPSDDGDQFAEHVIQLEVIMEKLKGSLEAHQIAPEAGFVSEDKIQFAKKAIKIISRVVEQVMPRADIPPPPRIGGVLLENYGINVGARPSAQLTDDDAERNLTDRVGDLSLQEDREMI